MKTLTQIILTSFPDYTMMLDLDDQFQKYRKAAQNRWNVNTRLIRSLKAETYN